MTKTKSSWLQLGERAQIEKDQSCEDRWTDSCARLKSASVRAALDKWNPSYPSISSVLLNFCKPWSWSSNKAVWGLRCILDHVTQYSFELRFWGETGAFVIIEMFFNCPPNLTFELQTDYCESYLASAKGNTMCCSSAGRRHHQGVCLTLDAPPAKWFWTVSKSTAPQRNLHSSGAKMWRKMMMVVMVEAQSPKLTQNTWMYTGPPCFSLTVQIKARPDRLIVSSEMICDSWLLWWLRAAYLIIIHKTRRLVVPCWNGLEVMMMMFNSKVDKLILDCFKLLNNCCRKELGKFERRKMEV